MKRNFSGLITDLATSAHSKARRGHCEEAYMSVASLERRIRALGPKERKSRESIVRKAKRVVGSFCDKPERDEDSPAPKIAQPKKGELNEAQAIRLLMSLGIQPKKWLRADASAATKQQMEETFRKMNEEDGRGRKGRKR